MISFFTRTGLYIKTFLCPSKRQPSLFCILNMLKGSLNLHGLIISVSELASVFHVSLAITEQLQPSLPEENYPLHLLCSLHFLKTY